MLELELCLTFEPRLIGYIIIIPTIVLQLNPINKTVTIVIPIEKEQVPRKLAPCRLFTSPRPPRSSVEIRVTTPSILL